MPTITIPKNITIDQDLIAVPGRLYNEFVEWQEKIKSVRTFKPTAAEKRALARARKNLAKGKYLTLVELEHALGFDR
ncbi:MAG: hypothetical protein AAB533_00025 [Patescibacteria group bacterium]